MPIPFFLARAVAFGMAADTLPHTTKGGEE
jgi:hypothetical protein